MEVQLHIQYGQKPHSAQEYCIIGCDITLLEITGGYIGETWLASHGCLTRRGSMENKIKDG